MCGIFGARTLDEALELCEKNQSRGTKTFGAVFFYKDKPSSIYRRDAESPETLATLGRGSDTPEYIFGHWGSPTGSKQAHPCFHKGVYMMHNGQILPLTNRRMAPALGDMGHTRVLRANLESVRHLCGPYDPKKGQRLIRLRILEQICRPQSRHVSKRTSTSLPL